MMKKTLAMAIATLLALGMILSGITAAAETSVQDALSTMLINCQPTYAETAADLTAHQSDNFTVGEGNATLSPGKEGLVMTTKGGEFPLINLGKRLDDVGRQINGNQAFHIKFKASQRDFELKMSAANNAGLRIGENGEAMLYLSNGEYWDTLTGDARRNVLTGGGGADTLIGNGGADTLAGGHGAENPAAELRRL